MMVGIERTCSQKDCLGACQHSSQCNYFTYDAKTQFCEMLSDCKFIDDTCKTCVSGEDQCSVNYLADAFGDYLFDSSGIVQISILAFLEINCIIVSN
jgi:hypothetical protein